MTTDRRSRPSRIDDPAAALGDEIEHADVVRVAVPGARAGAGENLSRFYFDRYGIETACLRIGSSFPQVKDRRMLATFLSYDDLVELVRCALFAPDVGHTVIFGVSNNSQAWWDNHRAAHLGFRAKDASDTQRARVEAASPLLDPADPARVYQGGAFTSAGPFDD